MTTVLFTKEYLAGDRAVLLNDGYIRDQKIYVVKNKLAYFIGQTHPAPDERNAINDAVYNYFFGNEEEKSAAGAAIYNHLAGDDVLCVMTKTDDYLVTIPHMRKFNTADGVPVNNELKVVRCDLRAPDGHGSGKDLAIAALHCGLTPTNIFELVCSMDNMTSREYDIVYRKDLK